DLPAPAASVPSTPTVAPQPVITTLVTRNVNNAQQVAQRAATPDVAPPPAPSSSPSTTATEAPPLPHEPAPSDQQTAAADGAQPAPLPAVAMPDAKPSAAGTKPTLHLLLGAIALLGFLASAAFFIMAMVRRRSDVLNIRHDTHTLPYEASPDMLADDRPPFR